MALESRGIRLGLDRIRQILVHLGHPERVAKQTLLIAGTNGKGSVAATLSAMARQAGVKAGLFTSPHLAYVNERYRVQDRDITTADFNAMGERVLNAIQDSGVALSHFEALATLAFLWFAECGVELQIMEIGLGGARDATRVAPVTHALLTGVALDHTEILGPTLEGIAKEKLGIFVPGVEGVVALPPSIRHMAPPSWLLGRDLSYRRTAKALYVWGPFGRLSLPRPTLLGAHQARNTALAAAMGHRLGFSEHAMGRALSQVRWRARMERLCDQPLTWLDGAHNPNAVSYLLRTLGEVGLSDGFTLVFGAHPKKDTGPMLRRLAKRAGTIICTTAERLQPPEDLAALLSERPDVHIEPDCEKALEQAHKLGRPTLVTGSLYLAGALLRAIEPNPYA